MTATHKTDVVVIGGGPAGSTCSALIAQQGRKVQLFEREYFPRFHIGESLIPETYHVIKRLGMLDKMKGSHFVKKHSVQFVNERGKLSAPFYFWDNKPHECSQTWQVRRSEFDDALLKNATEQGVEVFQGHRIMEVLFEGDRAVGVRVQDDDGNERTVLADVVVDASGQSTLITSRLGLRQWDSELKKAALWTYFKGAYRDTGRDEGATIVMQTEGKKGWFWYIPLHDDILSLGVVADYDYLFKSRTNKDHETIFWEEVARCPGLNGRLDQATRVEPFRAAKEYSYRASTCAGDGWVTIGDAFGFLDPLYSSGVLLALKSGQLAADAIVEGLAAGDTSAAQLGKWETEFVQGMNRMRRLVCEYYGGLSFGRLVKTYPHLQGPITDLLIGDLFKDSLDEVFVCIDELKAKQMATSEPA
jgi:flavin-dependent dehydrogenase